MTLSEFRYWLEGFEASFDRSFERPNSEQWAEIKAKLALVDAPDAKAPVMLPAPLETWPTGVSVKPGQVFRLIDDYADMNKATTAADSGVYEFYVGPSAPKTVNPASPKAEADDRN